MLSLSSLNSSLKHHTPGGLPLPSSVPNPLSLFHTKSVITKSLDQTYFKVDVPKHARKLEERERWLYIDRIDPNFGIKGNNQEVYIRRAYRRIESSNLFNPITIKDVSLVEIAGHKKVEGTSYMLVQESRLEELAKVEEILRDEKKRLQEQCVWALTDTNITLNVPTFATRMAVHNLCDADMRRFAGEISRLKNGWAEYFRDSKYDRNDDFMRDSFVTNAPLVQRAMKLKIAKEAEEAKRLRRENDTMNYEDDLSRLTRMYQEAEERRLDYDRYCVLSARYGCYTEEEYYKDRYPGKRYWNRATRATRSFQRVWGAWWSVQLKIRNKACTLIQKIWRGHYAYRRWHPLIKIRMRVGKRAYMIYSLFKWKRYVYLVKYCRDIFTWYRNTEVRNCYNAWRNYARHEKSERMERIRINIVRVTKRGMLNCFNAWARFIADQKKTKARLKRMMSNPCFDKWVRYTDYCRYVKKINKNATIIQSYIRMFPALWQYKKFKRVKKWFQARFRVEKTRINLYKETLEKWNVEEKERRHVLGCENERRRMARLQAILQEKEKANLAALKRHLNTISGRQQLNKMAAALELELLGISAQSNKLTFPFMNKGIKIAAKVDSIVSRVGEGGVVASGSTIPVCSPSLKQYHDKCFSVSTLPQSYYFRSLAERYLTERCVGVTQELEKHEFYAKTPTFLQCPDPACRAICISEEQFEAHLYANAVHKKTPKHFMNLLMMMRHEGFRGCIRNYLEKLAPAADREAPLEHISKFNARPSSRERAAAFFGAIMRGASFNLSSSIDFQQSFSSSASFLRGSYANLQDLLSRGGSFSFAPGSMLQNQNSTTVPSPNADEQLHPLLAMNQSPQQMGGDGRDGVSVKRPSRSSSSPSQTPIGKRRNALYKNTLAPTLHYFDAWLSIQDFKKKMPSSPDYYIQGMQIYDTFLRRGTAPRCLDLTFPTKEVVLARLERIKQAGDVRNRNFLCSVENSPSNEKKSCMSSLFRYVGLSSASLLVEWSEETTLVPSLFDEIEWECFCKILDEMGSKGRDEFDDDDMFDDEEGDGNVAGRNSKKRQFMVEAWGGGEMLFAPPESELGPLTENADGVINDAGSRGSSRGGNSRGSSRGNSRGRSKGSSRRNRKTKDTDDKIFVGLNVFTVHHDESDHSYDESNFCVEFRNSNEGRVLRELRIKEHRKKSKAWFLDWWEMRLKKESKWARLFWTRNDMINKLGTTTTEVATRKLYDLVVDELVQGELEKLVVRKRHDEQAVHEHSRAIVAETMDWTTSNICEELYDTTLRALVDIMLQEHKTRVTLMVFCGMEEKKLEKKLLIDMNRRNEAAELFKDLFG